MITKNLCAPALIYLMYGFIQVIMDSYNQLYNTATMKFITTFIFTLLLNVLCKRGLGVISWMIVFIPFVLMTLIVSILLIIFGLDPGTGKLISPPPGGPPPPKQGPPPTRPPPPPPPIPAPTYSQAGDTPPPPPSVVAAEPIEYIDEPHVSASAPNGTGAADQKSQPLSVPQPSNDSSDTTESTEDTSIGFNIRF